MSGLADRWPLSGADAVCEELLAAYADPARGYHDTRHLSEVLDRLDELEVAGAGFERLPVELAAWFHDAVYDGRPDAEARSAQWAEEVLAAHEPGQVAEVTRLVRLTEKHDPAEDDANGCALTDADLAILAAPVERYTEYAADVRREYAHVSDEAFRSGRAAVLADLLARPHLFHTEHARRHWEPTARTNAEAELRRLA